MNVLFSFGERTLKRFGIFLGTDTSYIARGSFWLTAGSLVGTLVAFALSLAYARYLPKDLYGNYRYVITILNMAGAFALSGIATSMVRSVAQGYEGTFRRGARIMFFSSFGATAVGLIAGGYFFYTGNTALGWGFLSSSLFVPFIEGMGNWKGYLDSKQEFRKKTAYNTLGHLFYGCSMLLAVAFVYMYNLTETIAIALLLGTYYITHALPNLILFLSIERSISEDAPQDPEAIRYGIHLSLSNIPSTIATYLDGVLLYAFLGPSALAVYSFAIALPEQIKGIFSTATTVAFPKLSLQAADNTKLAELKKTLPRKTWKASLITGFAILLYILAAPLLFSFLFPRYIEAVPLTQVFALSLIFFPFSIFSVAVRAEANIKKNYWTSTLPPFIQILLLLLLIPSLHLWGAVIARTLGRLFILFFPYILFTKDQ